MEQWNDVPGERMEGGEIEVSVSLTADLKPANLRSEPFPNFKLLFGFRSNARGRVVTSVFEHYGSNGNEGRKFRDPMRRLKAWRLPVSLFGTLKLNLVV